MTRFYSLFFLLFLLLNTSVATMAQKERPTRPIMGMVTDNERLPVAHALIAIQGQHVRIRSNSEGKFMLTVPTDRTVTLHIKAMGYEEQTIKIMPTTKALSPIILSQTSQHIEAATVIADGVKRLKESAFNTVSIDAKALANTSKTLSDALAVAPGVKVRESGGVGSDMSLSMDGFSDKHLKIFIDGVPQEGIGDAFSLNNIPVSFADRIEIYKGVVPVDFGTDAPGGVINIVTRRKPVNGWSLEASYTGGSFGTHKSHFAWTQSFKSGLFYELNAFQNHSKNNYKVHVAVRDFATGVIDRTKKEEMTRFHDLYHNETFVARVGVRGKSWADKLMFSLVYSQYYKDIQTGVRQESVFGEKHRYGHSLTPSLEYRKNNLFGQRFDILYTAVYNRNATTNVDTASYKYNWRGEQDLRKMVSGEQEMLFSRADNDNFNTTLNLRFRFSKKHSLTLNSVYNYFGRRNSTLLTQKEASDAIGKGTHKSVSGLSYRFVPSHRWNATAFVKYYRITARGPIETAENSGVWQEVSQSCDNIGYGLATTYFVLPGLQAKASYECATRLPSSDELFGDEDLETAAMTLRPERSHNLNFSLAYEAHFGKHNLMAETGFVFRSTQDYIIRNIITLSANRGFNASHLNYGSVLTRGINAALRYNLGKNLSAGTSLTYMNIYDNEKNMIGTSVPNVAHKARIPNTPYFFTDTDLTLRFFSIFADKDMLSVQYDSPFVQTFPLFSERIGRINGEYEVPCQISHNLAIQYAFKNGTYNLSLEGKNLSNAQLYDNFSLEKAGRAFYIKLRVKLGK